MIPNQTPTYEPLIAALTGVLTRGVLADGTTLTLEKPYIRMTKDDAYMIKRHGDKVSLLPLLMPEEVTYR